MRYPLPGPDFGGLKSFAFQLVKDSGGEFLLLHNDIVKMYLGYCAMCRLQRANPEPFDAWIQGKESEPTVELESSP